MKDDTARRIPAESEDEAPILGNPNGPLIQTELRTRRRHAEGQAALDQASVERKVVGACRPGTDQQEQRQSYLDYG